MAPDDVSNFDRRFTDQDIAASLFCETGEERMKHERGKYDDEGDWVHVDAEKFKDNPDRCGGGTGWEPVGDGDDEIDPDTIFSGFSYVAPSSLALTLESLRSSNH
ncbi:hypothetical protein EV182_003552 [Spiromyces aspiralis]|uniref:Uncharacterized protein n=1 Tax=Spiromyces aspiralis TaxID=68401 RepID=A0ACC1HK64_9FUNG|nr:hypothetical protein EV182_003552 [Spiromyces aspiralis]